MSHRPEKAALEAQVAMSNSTKIQHEVAMKFLSANVQYNLNPYVIDENTAKP